LSVSVQDFAQDFAIKIKRFNKLVYGKGVIDEHSIIELNCCLSQLLGFGERCPDTWSDTEIEAPEINNDELKKQIERRFPKFCYYNTTAPTDIASDKAEISLSDAQDDIYDIYLDLNKTLWHIENGNPQIGLWYAKLLVGHWGRHAIDLKSYLHKQIHDW